MSVTRFLRNLFVGREAEDPAPVGDPVRVAEVEAVLAELRPAFLSDGGDMKLVEVRADGRVVLRLIGACNGCGASTLTLQGALRPKLAERCTWFTGLESEDG